MNPVRVGNRLIGPGQPCLIIAEAGVNHNGDVSLAHRLIDAAAAAGADAIKFQSFVTEELITRDAPKTGYQLQTTGKRGSQYAMLKALELDEAAHAELKAHCERAGLLYLCTPYESTSVERLERLGVAAFKIASTDATNLPLLRLIASKGRPVILSTGMCTMAEVERAVDVLVSGGLGKQLMLLHCVSEYPAPLSEVNLRAIGTLRERFRVPVGFSDHTNGLGAGPWAVVAGACVIEKHFTIDCALSGPDHRASLEADEFAQLVRTIRQVEAALGDGVKTPMPCELANKPLMQKSVVAARPIRKSEVITAEALTCKRPGTGLDPSWLEAIVGRQAASDIAADQVVTRASVEWDDAGRKGDGQATTVVPSRRMGEAKNAPWGSLNVCALAPEWEKPLAAFFRVLRDTGDAQRFHPHPLTDDDAHRLAHYRGHDAYYVLVQDTTVLGYGMLRGWEEGFTVPSLGLAIHPSVRGRGLGQLFSRFLHEVARYRGAEQVRLKVYPDNAAALKLYRRLGYVFEGEEAEQLVGTLELAGSELARGECR